MLVEDFKKDINDSLKEIQQNTAKKVEAFKKETQKSLKELQENTTKKVKKLYKTIQDLKMEVETIKKSQRETTREIDIFGKKSRTINATISNRTQQLEEKILRCQELHRKHGYSSQRTYKMQKYPNSKHPKNLGHNEKTKPMVTRYR